MAAGFRKGVCALVQQQEFCSIHFNEKGEVNG